MSNRAVFLDRDGVLNEARVDPFGVSHPPASLEDLVIAPDARSACDALHALGLLLVVVSNQPDVARGTQRREVVEAINERLLAALPLDEIRVCYHDDPDGCPCRKPGVGLLFDASKNLDIDLAKSFMVGDTWRDIEAGRRAGCSTVLIGQHARGSRPDHEAASLSEAASWISGRVGG